MKSLLTVETLMRVFFGDTLVALALSLPAAARVQRFPPGFRTEAIQTDGATIHVPIGGKGHAIVVLHGFEERLPLVSVTPRKRKPAILSACHRPGTHRPLLE
jgi:hypothetical protein